MTIPIFDSLTHPSLDGSWIFPIRGGKTNSFNDIIEQLIKANVKWAWAVAMGITGAYDLTTYAAACANKKIKFLAAAYIQPDFFDSDRQIEDYLAKLQQLGYRGIKLHPRLGRFNLRHPNLASIICCAAKYNLIPLLCTYCYGEETEVLSIHALSLLLKQTEGKKLILLHGGVLQLLEVSELTRKFQNVLLDVSWTMCDYPGSSLDFDLRYVFERCAHRICVGSDSPALTPCAMRHRFEVLSEGLPDEKKKRIAHQNLLTYTGIGDEE